MSTILSCGIIRVSKVTYHHCQRSTSLGSKMTETLKWTHGLLATFVLLFSIWDVSHVQQKLISEGLMFVLYIFIFKISKPRSCNEFMNFTAKKNVVSWRRGASGLAFLPSPPCSENPTAPAWTVLQCPGPNGRWVHFGSVLGTRHIAYDYKTYHIQLSNIIKKSFSDQFYKKIEHVM